MVKGARPFVHTLLIRASLIRAVPPRLETKDLKQMVIATAVPSKSASVAGAVSSQSCNRVDHVKVAPLLPHKTTIRIAPHARRLPNPFGIDARFKVNDQDVFSLLMSLRMEYSDGVGLRLVGGLSRCIDCKTSRP